MLAVDADAPTIEPHLSGLTEVTLANQNSPKQTVLSGTEAGLAEAQRRLTAAGLRCQRLPVACGFHSPLVAAARQPLAQALAQLRFPPAPATGLLQHHGPAARAVPDCPAPGRTPRRPRPLPDPDRDDVRRRGAGLCRGRAAVDPHWAGRPHPGQLRPCRAGHRPERPTGAGAVGAYARPAGGRGRAAAAGSAVSRPGFAADCPGATQRPPRPDGPTAIHPDDLARQQRAESAGQRPRTASARPSLGTRHPQRPALRPTPDQTPDWRQPALSAPAALLSSRSAANPDAPPAPAAAVPAPTAPAPAAAVPQRLRPTAPPRLRSVVLCLLPSPRPKLFPPPQPQHKHYHL
jgi:hypothetical protein